MRVAAPGLDRAAAYPVAFASGVTGALAFPEPGVAPLAIVALFGLVIASSGQGARRGAALGFVFGLGFFGVLIYWISLVGVFAYLALVALESLFVGLFGAIWGAASTRWSGSLPVHLLGPAVLWVAIVEYARSVFPVRGFTWGQLAQSQHDVPHLLKVTGLGGSWLLAGLLVVVSCVMVLALGRFLSRRWGTALEWVCVAAGLLLAPIAIPEPSAEGRSVRVAIVQGNVPDMPVSFEKELAILRSHVTLTESLGQDVDLVVWPESAVGIDPEREPFVAEEIAAAARAVDAPMIVGGNLDLPGDRYRVMAFLISPEGNFIDRYQKTHLVPFGEYVPARRYLEWIPALDQIPRDAVAADDEIVFDLPSGRIAPVISFEGDFGSLVRSRIRAGGRLLVVATNTSTWGETWASAQHLAMSQVRAAENGVWVIHGAISGISAFVDPAGRVVQRTELWEATTSVSEVRFADALTPYARLGDWFAYLCVGLAIASAGVALVSRRRTGDTVE